MQDRWLAECVAQYVKRLNVSPGTNEGGGDQTGINEAATTKHRSDNRLAVRFDSRPDLIDHA